MNCPFCQSTEYIKNGVLKAGQRYLCKSCRRTFTQSEKADPASKEKRRLGLIMYLQGFGVTSIGRQLGVSHVTVIKWVTKYGKSFDEIRFHDPSGPNDPSVFRPGA